MYRLTASIFTFIAISVALHAEVDFIPTFDDKPASEEFIQKIEAGLPEAPAVDPKQTRKILIYSATEGFRHGSIPTGLVALEKLGKKTGAYEAVISNDPANFEPDQIQSFDAIVLLNTTNNFFMPTAKTERKNFTDEEWKFLQNRNNRLLNNLITYTEQGGGLVGIHAATDACYGHQGYGNAMGAYFWGHPWHANQNVTIVVEDPKHAVNQAAFGELKDFQIQEEIYQFNEKKYTRERLRILLHLDPERSDPPKGEVRRKDNDFAVSWVQKVEKGRVFYTSIGHNHHHFWDTMILKHYLAGIQFAMGDLEADTTPSAKIQVPHVNE
ncbi:MAG: ThuA domain-containing protein [Verrucomicrobiota bacterium]